MLIFGIITLVAGYGLYWWVCVRISKDFMKGKK